jgi:4-hydroxy-2-oxoheptanedioate aldolase
MKTNKILERVRNGEKALGLNVRAGEEDLIEMAAIMGLDYVYIEGQHTSIYPVTVEHLCRVADGFGITPAMRIPNQEESTILSYLDRGMRMITVPNLKTKEEAEALVRYTYYGPKGARSATGIRMIFNAEKTDRKFVYNFTNENTILVPQLESITAFENLDEILTVDGIDYFTGGPEDIAQSMGLPGEPNHPKALEAFAHAVEKVHAAGKHMLADVTEAIDINALVISAGEALLEKHGRKTKLPW